MKAIKFLLIIGTCLGLQLEASHHCPCKPKVTKEQKREKHKAHKEGLHKAKEDMRNLDKMNKCFHTQTHSTFWQSIPADKLMAKVKRDSNGDRI